MSSEENQNQSQQNVDVMQLVDVDDLVWQLGQDVVGKLGWKKLSERAQEASQKEKERADAANREIEKLQELKAANERLDQKNKELADALKSEREENAQLKADRDALQTEIDRRDKISRKKRNKQNKT